MSNTAVRNESSFCRIVENPPIPPFQEFFSPPLGGGDKRGGGTSEKGDIGMFSTPTLALPHRGGGEFRL